MPSSPIDLIKGAVECIDGDQLLSCYVVCRAAQQIFDADAKRLPGRERIRKQIEKEVSTPSQLVLLASESALEVHLDVEMQSSRCDRAQSRRRSVTSYRRDGVIAPMSSMSLTSARARKRTRHLSGTEPHDRSVMGSHLRSFARDAMRHRRRQQRDVCLWRRQSRRSLRRPSRALRAINRHENRGLCHSPRFGLHEMRCPAPFAQTSAQETPRIRSRRAPIRSRRRRRPIRRRRRRFSLR